MSLRNILFFLSVVFIVWGCNSENQNTSGEFHLLGDFKNASEILIQIEELTTQDLRAVDSVWTDANGHFSFSHSIQEAGFYIVRINPNNFITLLIEPGETIILQGDADSLADKSLVKGSPGSLKLAHLNNILKDNLRLVDSLAHHYQKGRFEPDFNHMRQELDMAYTRIFISQQNRVKEFISQNPRSLASIIALYKYFGNQLLLNENEHFEYFENLSQSLSAAYPGNKHVMDLKRRVNEHRRNETHRKETDANLALGSQAPEIVLPDPQGNPLALSSLRGKVVLVDFWAAWCPPCRQVNPRLKEIYRQFKPHGFEIYGISLDRTHEQWVAGIQEDNITWPQVSDLRFWSSPVVNLYNVEGIPYSVLIDQQGKIVAKGINLIELEELLNELLR